MLFSWNEKPLTTAHQQSQSFNILLRHSTSSERSSLMFYAFLLQEENQNIEIKAEEKRLWNEAETVMGGSNDSVLNSSDKQTNFEQTQSSQESALWHLVEGKLELEECF